MKFSNSRSGLTPFVSSEFSASAFLKYSNATYNAKPACPLDNTNFLDLDFDCNISKIIGNYGKQLPS